MKFGLEELRFPYERARNLALPKDQVQGSTGGGHSFLLIQDSDGVQKLMILRHRPNENEARK